MNDKDLIKEFISESDSTLSESVAEAFAEDITATTDEASEKIYDVFKEMISERAAVIKQGK